MDVAALGVLLDARPIEAGIKALDGLTASADKAEKSVQELGAESQGAFKKTTDAAKAAKAPVDEVGGSMKALTGIASAVGVAVAGGFGISKVIQFTGAVYEAASAAERLRTTLDFASGGRGPQELAYITAQADKLGLQLRTTAQAYSSLQAASRGTALEGEGARKVFEAVSAASSVMGLSAEQSSGALLALQQMVSKGTVQAEELRGQLGERLPGAFQIAARAMGVTTAELGKMLEQGLVPASTFLPKFADQLRLELGDAATKAADTLDKAVNRFDNAWDRLKRNVGESGVAAAAKSEIGTATEVINAISASMEVARASGSGFFGQMAAGVGSLARFNAQTGTLEQQIDAAQKTFDTFNARVEKWGYLNMYDAEKRRQVEALLTDLKAIKDAQDKVAMASGGAVSPTQEGMAIQGRAREAYMQAQAQAVADAQKLMLKSAGVPDSYVKDMTQVIGLYERGAMSAADFNKYIREQQADLLKKTGVTKDATAAEREYQQEQEKQKKLLLELSGFTTDFTDDAKRLQTIYEAGKITQAQYLAGWNALLAKQPAVVAGLDKQAKAQKQLNDAISAAREDDSKTLDAMAARNTAALESNKQLEQEIELIGKTARERLAIVQKRNEEAITVAELALAYQRAQDAQAGFNSRAAAVLEGQIEQLKERNRLLGAQQTRVEVQDTIDKQKEGWTDLYNTVVNSGREAFLALGQSGVDMSKRIADSIRATVMGALYELTVKRWIVTVGTSVLGSGFANAAGGTAGQAAASAGGNFFTSALGNMLGGTTGTLGSLWSGFSSAASEAMLGSAFVGPSATAATGATGLGASALGAIPYVAIAAAIGNALGLFRTTKQVGGGLTGTLGAGDIQAYDLMRKSGTLFSGPSYSIANQRGYEGSAGLQTAYDQLRTTVGDMADTLGIGSSAVRSFTMALGTEQVHPDLGITGIVLDGLTSEEAQKKIAEALTAASNTLAEQVLGAGSPFIKAGDDAITTLTRLAGNIGTVNKAFDTLGLSLFETSLQGADAASKLIEAFGSVDKFTELTTSYYQNFYSESERFNDAQRALRDQFASLNLTMPTSTAGFRSLVESVRASGDPKLLANVLALAPAFAQVAQAVEGVLSSITDSTAKSIRDIEMSVLGNAEKYAYLDKEIEGLITQIQQATNPAEVQALFSQASSDIGAAWGLLGGDEQKRLLADFKERYLELDAIAKSRLSVVGKEEEAAKTQEEIIKLQLEAQEEARATADAMRDAAQTNLEAITELRLAIQTLQQQVTGSGNVWYR